MINRTLPAVFLETAKKFKHKKAVSYKKDGLYYSLSYGKLADKIRIFAANMAHLGLKKGDRLAILSRNCPEWVVFDLGTMLFGGITVPIHPTLSPKIIAYVLNHSEAKIMIVNSLELLNKVLLVSDDLKHLKKIIYMGRGKIRLEERFKLNIEFWSEIMKADFSKKAIAEEVLPEVDSTDICSIIYTSGTTGLPKGVCLTHDNFLSDVEAVLKAVPVDDTDVFLSFLPLSHVLERTAGYYIPLSVGASVIYAESVKRLPKNLKEIKPTILISVPRVLEKFHDGIYDKMKSGAKWKKALFYYALKQPKDAWTAKILDRLVFQKVRKALGGHLRLIVSGGASLNPTIGKFFNKIGLTVLEGYGLTETSPVVAANRIGRIKFGTVGLPMDGIEIEIAEDREILVKGPIVMSGYYEDSAATAEAIDDDGWFHTGDLGFLDHEGYLTIIGRKKEMMVTSGGKNIWPEPIEQKINIDKYITQSMVVAHNRKFVSALIIPDWPELKKYLAEQGMAWGDQEEILANPKVVALFESRVKQINAELPDYEQIKAFHLLVNEFSEAKDEMTPTLKLRRQTIESHYKKEIESMY